MPKFSIIIPVYNSEKYLKQCIDSVLNQSYDDYEIIAINDKSNDNSEKILREYGNKINLHNVKEKNGVGPSHARNIGIKMAKGDYILFLDSDDYYEKDLLKKINEELDDDYDIVRFQIQYDYNGKKEQLKFNKEMLTFNNGIDAFNEICNYSIVESPCCYAFKREYFISNKFMFEEGLLHEDFGLIPVVIVKSEKVKCLSYVGYNYVVHENSIMTSNEYDKILKKTNDMIEHYNYIRTKTKDINGNLSIFNSYIANSLILKSISLKGKDYKKYKNKLKELKVYDLLLTDTFSRKIKKIILKISPKIYYKIVRG